jgi:hypothetical protein
MRKSWNPWSGCIFFLGEMRMKVMFVGVGNDEMVGKMMIIVKLG